MFKFRFNAHEKLTESILCLYRIWFIGTQVMNQSLRFILKTQDELQFVCN